jgi:glycosyltransferase involved in cell wall biosynthesis
MPTRDRRAFVAQAVAQFLAQDYPDRELIVVDDGDEAIADLLPADSRIRSIRLIRLDRRATIGAKRNIACEAAAGDVIVHWDDDDWMADWRLTYQVTALAAHSADVCGLSRLYFYDAHSRGAWQYVYPPGGNPWVAGGTLCYRKSVWRARPFADIDEGEDTSWVWGLGGLKILALDDPSFYVARIHAGNTRTRSTTRAPFAPCTATTVESMMTSRRVETVAGNRVAGPDAGGWLRCQKSR